MIGCSFDSRMSIGWMCDVAYLGDSTHEGIPHCPSRVHFLSGMRKILITGAPVIMPHCLQFPAGCLLHNRCMRCSINHDTHTHARTQTKPSGADGLVMLCAQVHGHLILNCLTHWGQDKMAAISQTTLSDSFSWMKMLKFRLKFHGSLFLSRVRYDAVLIYKRRTEIWKDADFDTLPRPRDTFAN